MFSPPHNTRALQLRREPSWYAPGSYIPRTKALYVCARRPASVCEISHTLGPSAINWCVDALVVGAAIRRRQFDRASHRQLRRGALVGPVRFCYVTILARQPFNPSDLYLPSTVDHLILARAGTDGVFLHEPYIFLLELYTRYGTGPCTRSSGAYVGQTKYIVQVWSTLSSLAGLDHEEGFDDLPRM